MPTLRLIPADEPPADQPLRFPTEAVRAMNDARSASAASCQVPESSSIQRGSPNDVLNALHDLSRRADALTRDLDVLGHLGGDDDHDDPPRAA